MSTVHQRQLRVAASTSNLGPGFDFLGIALDVWLDVRARAPRGNEFDTHGVDARSGTAVSWPDASDDLFFHAFDRAREALGLAPLALRIAVTSEIPLGRGLGSSGAAIAAGLILAAGWEEPARAIQAREELVRIGAELEGHPDNTTASLHAGCTLAVPRADGYAVIPLEVHPSIGFAVAWPATGVPTAAARAALPEQVPFADAVENPRRFAALAEGLRTGTAELLALGLEDRLHVPHRLPLIPGGAAALRAALDAGAWGATISGSGSTLIALGPREGAPALAEAMRVELDRHAGPATGRAVEVVREPPLVR